MLFWLFLAFLAGAGVMYGAIRLFGYKGSSEELLYLREENRRLWRQYYVATGVVEDEDA